MKKITPFTDTGKTWVGDDGHTYKTRRSKDNPRITVSLSTYKGGFACDAMHYYCRIRGDRVEIYDVTDDRTLSLGGYGKNKPTIHDFTFDAERAVTEYEEDMSGEQVGSVGGTTSRFNTALDAFKAGIETVLSRFQDTKTKHWIVTFDYCGEKLEGREFRLNDLKNLRETIINEFEFEY